MTDKKKTAKILNKIRNMLEMAARAEGNEEEAATAARMAENLMRKHNLSMVDITPEEAKNNVQKDAFKKMKWTTGKCPVWVNRLAVSIANTYDTFCMFVDAGGNDSHVQKQQCNLAYVGDELDVAVSIEMLAYLYTTVNRLTDEWWDESGKHTGVSARTAKMNYRDGMAMRLKEKLREIQVEKEKEIQEATKTGTGLMVVKKDAIADYLGFDPSYTNNTRQRSTNRTGFSAGYTKGGSVSLNKQVN